MPASQEKRSDVSSRGCGDDPRQDCRAANQSHEGQPLKPSEVLERAAALVEPEGAWTQGVRARNGRGQPVDPASPEATCWCVVGAVERVDPVRSTPYPYANPVLRRLPVSEPGSWNDYRHRTQAEVVQALRQAAELARKEGQ